MPDKKPKSTPPPPPDERPANGLPVFIEARRAVFLTELGRTGSIRGSASRAGVSHITIYRHAEKDPAFAEAVARARGEWEQAQVDAIVRAANVGKVIERRNGTKIEEPGDWHAAAWLLEHHPATRERYAGIMRQKVEVGGDPDGVAIQTEHVEKHEIEIGPDTMERLGRVVGVLIQSGKLRLPDPGEVVDGQSERVE